MSQQSLLFLLTVCAGGAIGFIFDVFRIFRKTVPHANPVIQLEDLLFWLLVTFLMFYFMLNENYGEIRLFSILGAILGAALYFCTLSLLVMKVSVAVIQFWQKVFVTALHILLTPFRLLAKLLAPLFLYFWGFCQKHLKFFSRYAKMKKRKLAKNFSIMRKKV